MLPAPWRGWWLSGAQETHGRSLLGAAPHTLSCWRGHREVPAGQWGERTGGRDLGGSPFLCCAARREKGVSRHSAYGNSLMLPAVTVSVPLHSTATSLAPVQHLWGGGDPGVAGPGYLFQAQTMSVFLRAVPLQRVSSSMGSLRRPGCAAVAHMAWRCPGRRGVTHDSTMLKHLLFKIKSTGPITVAEYMREVLTNPLKGYYLHRDMLGEEGDFVTSPEISQMFGELLGIWCISEWMGAGKPNTLQLVELGPGRGTLTEDILRVFSHFQSLLSNCDISIHLVEISPKLSEIQALTLTGGNTPSDHDKASYKKGTTKLGLPVFWYQVLGDVPQGFTLYLAHEFFDALPIHKFQKTERGWMEVLIAEDPQVPDKLCFVLSPSATLAARTLIPADETRDHVEVCPDAGVVIQELACRIRDHGGGALIADYGHDGSKTDTFRGFRDHELHDVLLAPGSADLTADVDFSYLRRMLQGKVASLGPITQQEFLTNMGIDIRLKVLLGNSKDRTTQQQLQSGYDMLVNPDKMGERFKFFALLPHDRLFTSAQQMKTSKSKTLPLPVAGFSRLSFE